MTENPGPIPAQRASVILPEVRRVRFWEKSPSRIVIDAVAAFNKQQNKPPRLLGLKTNPESEGIYMVDKWGSRYTLSHIGQPRGIKDLTPRGGSAHQVTFCTATFRDSITESLITTNIALKPFNNRHNAIREAKSTIEVLGRGIKTVDPICVIADGARSFLISSVRRDVISIDQDRWDQFNSGIPGVKEHLLSVLEGVGLTLADLHIRGINHSDAQLKNFWQKPDGTVEPFDWEAAKFVTNPPTLDEFSRIALDDLRNIFNSVTGQYEDFGFVIFSGPPSYRWNRFNDHIFTPYSNRLLVNLGESYLEAIIEIESKLRESLNIT